MNLAKQPVSLQARLLSPLVGLLLGIALVFSYLTWNFYSDYSIFRKKLALTSDVAQHIMEVTRLRARSQELLMLYRQNTENRYLTEIRSITAIRASHIERLKWMAQSDSSWKELSAPLIGGLEEGLFLQESAIAAIEARDKKKTDLYFDLLSTIFEINSARLKDFSARLQFALQAQELELQKLLKQTFWMCVALMILILIAIWSISLIYQRSVLKPLRSLHHGLKSLTHGQMETHLPEQKSPREISEMVADFNQMVTVLKTTQADLMRARESALQAARIKSDFLSNMSHEIRTPMNTILGMADELAEGSLPEEKRKFVQILRHSGKILVHIINDILDYSKLEAGRVVLESTPFNLRELVEQISDVIAVSARKRGLAFQVLFSPPGDCWVLGDAKRIEQILLNLLGNAVKFTEAGRVSLVVNAKKQTTHMQIEMRVEDTGIGIESHDLGHIFNRFSQSDTGITKKFGGTGLGLAIVKQLVEIMKGDVSVQSQPGQGSQFCIHMQLPVVGELEKPDISSLPEKPSMDASAILRNKRILLVDDSVENQFLIQTFLKKTGCEIRVAENGQQAVEFFQKENFDLIFMDMQMPVMDGCTATKRIRQIEALGSLPRTPIIALTAFAMPEEIQRSLSAGCDLHLTKPIRKSELIPIMAQFLNKLPAAPESPMVF